MRSVLKQPYTLAHDTYHALVPYNARLLVWSYRRRKAQELREYLESANRELVRRGRGDLAQVISQYPDARGVVIISPTSEWDTSLFQRPQQMAMAFASLGYVVLYWVRPERRGAGERIQKLQHGLYVCDVPAPVFSVAPGAIVIAYTHNYNWVRRLRNSPTIVYDIVDHLEIYSDFPLRMLRFNQKTLLQQARVVSATADDLLKAILPARPDAVLCPNGVDIDHFKTPTAGELEIPADIAPIFAEGKPIIGYYGAVAEWFDFELVKHAAGALDQYNYVLIGPDYDGRQIPNSGIDSVPNIYWLGPKLYRELPAYLRTFAVATIPFKLSEALHAVSPIKLFEYMAGGKPIVTTDLAECRKYPVVAIAHNKEEWVDCLVQAVELSQNESYLQSLRQTAEDNTWTARCRTVLNALQTAQGGADSSRQPHLVPSTRLM